MIHKAEIDNWMKEKCTHKKELAKSCAPIISHCSAVMKSQIKALPNHKSNIRDDPIELLKAIQNKMHDPERNCHPFKSITKALQRTINMRQNQGESLIDCAKHHKQGTWTLSSPNWEALSSMSSQRNKKTTRMC